jgi:hypothetical protein
METLALRTARQHVQSYQQQSEEILAQYREAMESGNCEDHLQLGIEAFRWIERAEQRVEQAAYEGKITYEPKCARAITDLYEAWLVPCDAAEERIQALLSRGYDIENVAEFRECCVEAYDRLEQRWLTHIAWKALAESADSE